MDKKGHIRLSTMEIVLLLTLGASLVLGLLQAYQQTRLDDAQERQSHASDDAEPMPGEQ